MVRSKYYSNKAQKWKWIDNNMNKTDQSVPFQILDISVKELLLDISVKELSQPMKYATLRLQCKQKFTEIAPY